MAYYKVHSAPCVVMEAVKMFRQGSIQHVPTVTHLSTSFCRAACGMARHEHSLQDMNSLLGNAATQLAHVLQTAERSLSWSSHLMALNQLSQVLALVSPVLVCCLRSGSRAVLRSSLNPSVSRLCIRITYTHAEASSAGAGGGPSSGNKVVGKT